LAIGFTALTLLLDMRIKSVSIILYLEVCVSGFLSMFS